MRTLAGFRHTRGPWAYNATTREIRHKALVIARLPHALTNRDVNEFPGNARLMTEAAEMFDLLREVYEHQGAGGWPGVSSERDRFVAVMERLGITPPGGDR